MYILFSHSLFSLFDFSHPDIPISLYTYIYTYVYKYNIYIYICISHSIYPLLRYDTAFSDI